MRACLRIVACVFCCWFLWLRPVSCVTNVVSFFWLGIFFITPLVFLTFILARTKTNHNWYFYQFLFSQVYIWTTLYISALLIKTQLRSIHQNKSNNLVDDLSWKMQLSLFAIDIMFYSNNIAIDSWENGWWPSELVLCFLFC